MLEKRRFKVWLQNKTLRSGISVSLCILASKLLNLKYPFFAALPAIVPISNNLEEIIKSGGNRMIGSTLGAGVGIILALIQPSNPLLTGIGVILIIYLCKFINWESSASIACLIFISIMVGLRDETALFYSLHRLLDTFIGIAITTVINNIAFSINIYSTIIKKAEALYHNLLKEVENKIYYNTKPSMDMLNEKMKTVYGLLNVYKNQLHFKNGENPKLVQLDMLYRNLKCISNELGIINSIEKSCVPNSENADKLAKIFNCEDHYEKYYDSEINIVYNYHLGRMLKAIEIIENKKAVF